MRGAGPAKNSEPAITAGAAASGARLDTFAKDGESYFALSLAPTSPPPAAKPRDVVILFDTSASQTGAYRDKAMEALDATLAGLSPSDHVRLYAVDLNAIPLMDRFAAANSPETARHSPPCVSVSRSAQRTWQAHWLRRRIRLSPRKVSPRGRAAVYIGDGMSTANLLGSDALHSIVDQLGGAARAGEQLMRLGRASMRSSWHVWPTRPAA